LINKIAMCNKKGVQQNFLQFLLTNDSCLCKEWW
jgi:hypothetical protein